MKSIDKYLRRLFQGKELPARLLFVLIVASAYLLLARQPLSTCDAPWPISLMSESGWQLIWQLIMGLSLTLITAGVYRSVVRDSGILGVGEPVSLWPMGLLLLPAVKSCNSSILLLVALVMVLIYLRIVRIADDESASRGAYEGGLMVGALAIINPAFFALGIYLILAIAILRALHFRSVIWVILGTVTPWYLIASGRYLLDIPQPLDVWVDGLVGESPVAATLNPVALAYLIITIAFSLWTAYRSFVASRSAVTKRRKTLQLALVVMLLMVVLSLLLLQFYSVNAYTSLLALPLSLLSLQMYQDKDSRYQGLVFLIWTAATILFISI